MKDLSEHKFSNAVLFELLQSLYKIGNGKSVGNDSNDFISFAESQKFITMETIVRFIKCFSDHFLTNRRSFGLHGLYPNHSDYTEIIWKFYGTLSFAFVHASFNADSGMVPQYCKFNF